MSRAYHELPDEVFTAAKPEPLPADFSFNDSQPPPEADFTGTGGRFRKGHDPRRHAFTREECSAGFWAGLASYVELGGRPGNFLKRKMAARGQAFIATPRRDRGRRAA